jgi:hypothetical protein
MQRNDPEKREVLEVRDLERPLGRGLTRIDAVIEVVKSDCAEEWGTIATWLGSMQSMHRDSVFF